MFVYGSPGRTGGHHKSGLAMLKNLQEMGHHIIVVSFGAVKEMVSEIEAAGAEFIAVPQMKNVLEMKRAPYFPIMAGHHQIEQIAKERSVDIIHAYDFQSVGRAFLAAIRLRKGFVFTKAGGPSTPKMGPRKTDTILFSQENLDGYRYGAEGKSHLIQARIDTTEYKPSPVDKDFIRKYNLHASGKKIVMASRLRLRLHSKKKPLFNSVIEASLTFANMPDPPRIYIAGEGPMLPDIQEEARQVNGKSINGPVLNFIGPIFSPKDMVQLYNYSDLVLGSGRGILEAMACGKPVVILGENNEAEVVGPENIEEVAYYNFSGRHFRQRKKSPEPLSELLRRLVEDTDRMRQLGEYSLDYIKTQMEARLGVKQLVNVYEKAIEQKSALTAFFIWYIDTMYHSVLETMRKRIFGRQI